MHSPMKRGFTLIELLVVIAIIAILASILFPVFAKAREKARQATCTSQVRQIATAIQMYVQDNQSQYPGIDGGSWISKITQYLGNSDAMFRCPSDTEGGANAVSYAYSGLLVRSSGLGVKEAAVTSPSEVGALCDATPSEVFPNGRLIGGGALAAEETNGAKPKARHSNGIVTGYCDGHAKYYQGSFDEKDMASDATRAFYMVASLGLIDNPTGMQGTYTAPGVSMGSAGIVNLGGEYAAKPFLDAAGAVYTGGVYSRGYLGQSMTTGRNNNNYLWGTGTVTPGETAGTTSAIAYDAICIIVAKGSKIPTLPTMSKKTYVVNTAYIRSVFNAGYIKDSVQVYKMADYTGTTQYVKGQLQFCNPVDTTNWLPFGTDSIQVENDVQMVEKVANDPYAIGYCSSAYADPDRVVVLGIDLGTDGYTAGDWIWPNASDKFRWVLPTRTESNWGWKRALNVAPSADGTGGAYVAALARSTNGNGFMAQMQLGPYFKVGYWPGVWMP